MVALPDRAPGPKGLPILGNIFQMGGTDPLVFWRRTHAAYGDTIRLKLGPMDVWFFAAPDTIYEVFVSRHRLMRKGIGYSGLRKLLGEGLITTDKAHWSSQRERLNPVFTPGAIDSYTGAVFDACLAGLPELEELAAKDAPIDIGHAMTRLTMRVISRAAFGVDLGEGHDKVVEAFEFAFAFVADITAQPLRPPLFVPTPKNQKFAKALGIIQAFVDELIDRSRAQALTGSMSGSIFEALSGIDRKLFRDEVISLYFAGFETTARSMTFMMDLLARHPVVLRSLREEADGLNGSIDLSPVAQRLPVATEIVNEALRLFPPAAMMARQPNSDCEIGGYEIRAGSLVIVCPFLVQRNTAYWPAGEDFDPDPARPLATRLAHRGAFAPFGGGPRLCLGKHFAMVELALAIAMMAREFDWSLDNTKPLELAFHGTLRPRERVLVRLSRRDR